MRWIIILAALMLIYVHNSAVAKELSYRDIPGTYIKERGNAKICPDKVKLRGTSSTRSRKNIKFYGKRKCRGRLHLKVSSPGQYKQGTVLKTRSSTLKCGKSPKLYFIISRPHEDFERKFSGDETSYVLHGDKKYLEILYDSKRCVYIADVAGPSKVKSDTCEKDRKNPWKWRGPVIGAAATIAGAIIGAVITASLMD